MKTIVQQEYWNRIYFMMIHVIYATSIDYDFLSIQQYCTFIQENKDIKSFTFDMFQKQGVSMYVLA